MPDAWPAFLYASYLVKTSAAMLKLSTKILGGIAEDIYEVFTYRRSAYRQEDF